jgi:hypothetical protein
LVGFASHVAPGKAAMRVDGRSRILKEYKLFSMGKYAIKTVRTTLQASPQYDARPPLAS